MEFNYKMIKKIKFIICFITFSFLFAADCTCCLIEEYFNESISYYPFSFFNSTSDQNQPLLYKYIINDENCPDDLFVNIKYSIYSPYIGINSYQDFYNGEIKLDKDDPIKYFTNNNLHSTSLNDVIGNKNLETLYSYISKSGSMPNGKYQINISLNTSNQIIFNSSSKLFEINIPNTLELLSPGGPIENLSNSFIFNTTPVFTWYTDYCQLCEYAIRICEYNKDEHSSLEEAFNDWSLVPSDPSQMYKSLGSMAQSFQYPADSHINLEKGKYYVWQIKRSFNELFDVLEDYSDIYIFEIRSMDKLDKDNSNPYLTVIESIIGSKEFNLLFGPGGELESFIPSSNKIELNGTLISIDALYSILSELESNNAKLEGLIVK